MNDTPQKTSNIKKIVVGVSDFAPLVINKNGTYRGFEIELWEKVATMLDVQTEYKKYDFVNLLSALTLKEIDVGVAGISRTVEREKIIDFTHLTFTSGLKILISENIKDNIFKVIKSFFTQDVLKPVLFLAGFVMFCAHLMWYLERGLGSIALNYKEGIMDAVWWAVVTISTVGYGDIVPVTVTGRIMGIFIIFIGFLIFGLFIGYMSSKLTYIKIHSAIHSQHDLKRRRVGTVAGSTTVDVLVKLDANIVEFTTIEKAYKHLSSGRIDAIVFDAPVLEHYQREHPDKNFILVGQTFEKDTFGFAVATKSTLRQKINVALLYLREVGYYDELYEKWFGKGVGQPKMYTTIKTR